MEKEYSGKALLRWTAECVDAVKELAGRVLQVTVVAASYVKCLQPHSECTGKHGSTVCHFKAGLDTM